MTLDTVRDTRNSEQELRAAQARLKELESSDLVRADPMSLLSRLREQVSQLSLALARALTSSRVATAGSQAARPGRETREGSPREVRSAR